MAGDKQKQKDIQAFTAAVESRDWFVFMSPVVSVNIERELLNRVARHIPAAAAPAVLAQLYVQKIHPRLRYLNPGQQEFALPGPLAGVTVHFGILGGVVYIGARPLMPYR